MGEAIMYAKVDGPPDDWASLQIVDLDSGEEVHRVLEVNAGEGWLVRACRDEAGMIYTNPEKPDEIATERITGRFEIRRSQ
ncbi:hypothetical protein [Phenylobacterium sp. 58.2.17]|uniref:hypothetical protein n=1 Tax=Phenylobacterium sp. 58.2.17 TaxID=2969306 RepID=UPI0022645BE9|nr:hypothetical protein [Phenylobacterium sp. 58.2.17]MCX7585018.1 hypothetical protein [Phenylobacterium sp. 58.2.17]